MQTGVRDNRTKTCSLTMFHPLSDCVGHAAYVAVPYRKEKRVKTWVSALLEPPGPEGSCRTLGLRNDASIANIRKDRSPENTVHSPGHRIILSSADVTGPSSRSTCGVAESILPGPSPLALRTTSFRLRAHEEQCMLEVPQPCKAWILSQFHDAPTVCTLVVVKMSSQERNMLLGSRKIARTRHECPAMRLVQAD